MTQIMGPDQVKQITDAIATKYPDDPVQQCIAQTAMDICLKINSVSMTQPNDISEGLLKFYADIFGKILDHVEASKELELGKTLAGPQRLSGDSQAASGTGAEAHIPAPETD